MKKIMDQTFLRFVLVGIINTIFGTAIMFIFYNCFHLGYWISSASNYILGSILSFFLNKYFTFQKKEGSWKQILRFILNISLCYLVAYGIARPVIRIMLSACADQMQDNAAMLGGMVLFVVLNYIGQRCFVFKKQGEENDR